MKQLTENPSVRSELLGWKLMMLLCQQVLPGADIIEFVRAFLRRNSQGQGRSESAEVNDEISSMARQCMKDTEVLSAHADEAEGVAEVGVQVYLIDQSTRKIYIEGDTTLQVIGEKLALQIGVYGYQDFSFFQLTDGLESHRLLPNSAKLNVLTEKWQTLENATGRRSRLMWKRRFMRFDELLNAGDLMHATLTYRQVLWDYLHYPIVEDQGLICSIAASILCAQNQSSRHISRTKGIAF